MKKAGFFISIVATLLSIAWFIANPDFEPVIVFLFGVAGISTTYKQILAPIEEVKIVNINWPSESGFDSRDVIRNLSLYWARKDKIESYKLNGYKILYDIDAKSNKKFILETYDGLVLLGKPND